MVGYMRLGDSTQDRLQWILSKMVTGLGSQISKTASLAPTSTKGIAIYTFIEQQPLYKGQLELTHR